MRPLLLALAAVGSAACGGGDETAGGAGHGALIWSDEFEGPAGGGVDLGKWSFEVGGGGWGNQEWQHYTDRPENAALDGAGALAITARRERYGREEFTSARLTTRGKFSQAGGRIEARIKLPVGQGLWPAFWLLGDDIATAPWPACGEIDVMEARGAQPSKVSASAHGPGYAGGRALIGGYAHPDNASLADDFHDYAVDWTPQELRFSVDGKVFHTVKATRLPEGAPWVFNHPFFITLNLAVGGTFGGPPDPTTPFPQSLRVAHLRVYAP